MPQEKCRRLWPLIEGRDSVRFGKGIKKDFMEKVILKMGLEEQVGF